MSEREKIVAFLRSCARYWREEMILCGRNQLAVDMASAKAEVLDGCAKDIEEGLHEREENRA